MAYCVSPITIQNPHKNLYNYIQVPCGKCCNCKKNRANQWLVKMKEEIKQSKKQAYFVTLTYNNKSVPVETDPETGEIKLSTSKTDCQTFIKRLRSNLPYKIKYYMVSEFGGKTGRPHYHAIIFGIDINDVDKINQSWNSGRYIEDRGYVYIGTATDESIRYVLKYIRKQTNDPGVFQLYSKDIGNEYVNRMKKYHITNPVENYYYTEKGGIKYPLPRIYKKKLFSKITNQRIGKEISLKNKVIDFEKIKKVIIIENEKQKQIKKDKL